MTTRIFTNGTFFTGGATRGNGLPEEPRCGCMVVRDSQITHIGTISDDKVRQAREAGAEETDLEGRIVVPGFIDAHVHILFFGLSRLKLNLEHCTSLQEIRSAITKYAKSRPDDPRIICRGWQQFTTKGSALASDIDDLDPRPIFIEALDLHSTWCSTAALGELPVDEIKATFPQYLPCDKDGKPTGLVAETATAQFVWPHLLSSNSPEATQHALATAFGEYSANGYTGIIDMAMDQPLWTALQSCRQQRSPEAMPVHVAAHWFVAYDEDPRVREARLAEAISMHKQWHPSKDRDFCIVGIKLINDGVVDGCTAALTSPYGGGTHEVAMVHPIWPREAMMQVVKRASEAGMQVAIHAIGDAAVKQAVDCIEAADDSRGRHRIEHLEITRADDATRLGKLGITASVQPIHSDPARLLDYAELVGPERFARAFPYREFLDGNARVCIGTDSPTASHVPWDNMYSATTRKSVSDQTFTGRVNPDGALTLAQAMAAATTGAAYSRFADGWVGSLKAGMQADFLVLDASWNPNKILDAKVEQTWSRGEKVHQAHSDAEIKSIHLDIVY